MNSTLLAAALSCFDKEDNSTMILEGSKGTLVRKGTLAHRSTLELGVEPQGC